MNKQDPEIDMQVIKPRKDAYDSIENILVESGMNLNECMSVIGTLDVECAKRGRFTYSEYEDLLQFKLNIYKEYIQNKEET